MNQVDRTIWRLGRFILFSDRLSPPRDLLHGARDDERDRVQERMHPLSKSAGADPADTVVQADDAINVRVGLRVVLG